MQKLTQQLKDIVGPNAWVTDRAILEPHVREWRDAVRGVTPIMVSPATTDEVSAVVRACAAAGVGIVPQGGNTGMCAGAIPDESGTQVILNLRRMDRIRSVDPDNFSMVAEAGCILANIQAAARDADRYFPLSLGGEGSCQIGGNLSTDAGGINVIRYGTARGLVLGVEVVLADGTVWDGLKTLRKDTAGYDLKQLFIGSEGTLGIITAVAIKLFPDPGPTSTALLALDDAAQAVELLAKLRRDLVDRIQAFELIGRVAFDYVERHIPDARVPFETAYPWYVLIDAAIGDETDRLTTALASANEAGLVATAIVAKNDGEAAAFWRLRHSISEAQRKEGKGLKHDVSVPISRMQEFLAKGENILNAELPEAKLVVFGHVGDGNLHYNVVLPENLDAAALRIMRERATTLVYDLVTRLGGSISAEHGIGLLKKAHLATYAGAVEMRLMRTLKDALDPDGVLNPGKVI